MALKIVHEIRLMKNDDMPFLERGMLDTNWQDIPEDQRILVKREDCDIAMLEDYQSCKGNEKLKFKMFVATDADDMPLGFISVGVSQLPTVKLPYGLILDFYVDEIERNKGIGQELLDYVLEYFHKQGYSHAGLYVSKMNEAALHLYRKNGFDIDRILMMKRL